VLFPLHVERVRVRHPFNKRTLLIVKLILLSFSREAGEGGQTIK
jgi:hypothetical protein